MRVPKEVARQIKTALKIDGIVATVRSRNYQIKVETRDKPLDAHLIAKDIYHQEKHAHLVVWVDGRILPMPKP